jgi:hypothetical protein
MDFQAILAALGGAKKRGMGPLAQPMPGMAGGPLAPQGGMMGTQANGIPQPLERIDPGASSAPSTPGHMAGNLNGLPVNPNAPTPMDAVADLPLQGPLAQAPSLLDSYNAQTIDDGPVSLTPAAERRMALGPLAPGGGEKAKKGGIFSRIGDFIGSDEGRGALLRGSAALLDGGSVGEGIQAGANFVDARRKERIGLEQADREFGQRDRGLDIQQQGVDQSGLYQAGVLENSSNQNLIRIMSEERAGREFAARQGLDWAKLSLQERSIIGNLAMRNLEEEGRQFRHGTVSANTAYTQDQTNQRTDKTIGARSDSGLGTVTESTKQVAEESPGLFSRLFGGEGTPGTPARSTKMKVNPLPSDPSQATVGAVYATRDGPARWNGRTFELVQ